MNKVTQSMLEEYIALVVKSLIDQGVTMLINVTPTSEKRNHYTDAQLHLMSAIESLRKAGTL